MDLARFVPDEKQRLILEAIMKRGPVWVQHLIDYFDNHPSCRMSKATFYRHLNRLMETGTIEMKMVEGKAYYSLKGKGIRVDFKIAENGEVVHVLGGDRERYERKPPSEFDHFVLGELKKLISDMIASGLGYEAGDEGEAEAALEARIEQRVSLCQRAYTLLDAITFLEERRDYKLPSPEPIRYEDWYFDRNEITGDEMERRYSDEGVMTFLWWFNYYLAVADELSRALTNNACPPLQKKKKATPRP